MYKSRLMTARPSQTIDHVQSSPSPQTERAHLSPQGHHNLTWPRLQRMVMVARCVCVWVEGECVCGGGEIEHIKLIKHMLHTIKNETCLCSRELMRAKLLFLKYHLLLYVLCFV